MSDCSGGHHLCADDNNGVCAEQSNSNAVLSALNRKRKEGGIRVQRKVFCVLKMKYEVLLTSIIHPATIGQVRFAGGNNVSFCDDFNI